MPRLRSRSEFPPTKGAWQFYQAQTNWHSTPHIGFNETVNEIIQHRKGNPRFNLPTDREAVESELEDFKVQQILALGPLAAGFLMDAPEGGYAPSFPLPRPNAGGAAGGAKKAVAGAAILIDWLGDGMKPVTPEHSMQRAMVCATCQFNKEPSLAQKAVGVAARAFHLLMEHKNDYDIKTPLDSKLQTCQVCDCDLKLKVHAEMAHIKKYTKPATYEALDKACWIRSEWGA